ncbi:MAG: hypothetical protein RR048_06340 [Oscillospiraceae bacterium]
MRRCRNKNYGCSPICIAFGLGIFIAMFCSLRLVVILASILILILSIQLWRY